VRDQFLEHFGGKLPVRDAEGKIALDDGPDVHLGRQVVLDDRLSRVLDRLKLALHQGGRESAVPVDVNFVNVILRVSQKS